MNRERRRRLLSSFVTEKKSYKKSFFNMIYSANDKDIIRIFKGVLLNNKASNKLRKIMLPKSLADISSERSTFNSTTDADVLNEVSLCFIKLFNNEINQYVQMKLQYECHLISERYCDAYILLEKIEDEICVSIWSCIQRMVLLEKLYGLEEHKKCMSGYILSTRRNLIIDTLIGFKSHFIETNTSHTSYQDSVKNFLSSIRKEDSLFKYFGYKLRLEDSFDIDELLTALHIDSQFSIIDLYECYIEYIQLCAVKGKMCQGVFQFAETINDYRIKNLVLVSDYSKLKQYIFETSSYHSMIDMFFMGEYDCFIKRITDYLYTNPSDFNAVMLLIEAHIKSYKHLVPGLPNIYYDIYNIYVINSDTDSSIMNAYNFMKIYQGTSWETRIRGIISQKIINNFTLESAYKSDIDDHILNVHFVRNISDKDEQKRFIDSFSFACPIAINIYKYINSDMETLTELVIDNKEVAFYEAEKHSLIGHYDEAVNTLCRLKSHLNTSDLYNNERINDKLIELYINNRNYYDLIKLVVNSYLVNIKLVRKIDIGKLINTISVSEETVSKNIHYVNLVYINDRNDYKKQRIAYSNFMDSNNFACLDDVFSNISDVDSLVFFMENVCSLYLLKRDIILNGNSDDADEIRMEILRRLISLNPSKKKAYYNEIGDITKQISIRDRIKQINHSRIYVDIENIKKENLAFLQENFNRYLLLKDFNEDIFTLDITSEEYIASVKRVFEDINEQIKSNPVFSQKITILKGLITRIVEEFLYNEKYGLNTFLSTRIRHGYCKSQLTSVFQDYYLLSKKKRDDSLEYTINEYWDDKLGNTNEEVRIKERISQFTRSIELKVHEVQSNWLCIKYKEDNNALLDYSNCINSSLIIERENIVDFDAFFNEVIAYLWEYTEIHFIVLRDKITNDLLQFFLSELDVLEKDIYYLATTNDNAKQICTNINLCKSKIAGRLEEFSNVFFKRDVDYKDFHMKELVETCLEISGKLNHNLELVTIEKRIVETKVYTGEIFPYFVDIVNILITNATDHSGFKDASDLSIGIEIELVNDYKLLCLIKDNLAKKGIKQNCDHFVAITISNALAYNTDTDKIMKRLEDTFQNINSLDSFRKYIHSEGGTGLYKLNQILKYNIYAPYLITYGLKDYRFEIKLIIGIDKIIVKENEHHENSVYRR